jgi:hypothetical protein
MKCERCHNEIVENSKYCNFCGKRVRSEKVHRNLDKNNSSAQNIKTSSYKKISLVVSMLLILVLSVGILGYKVFVPSIKYKKAKMSLENNQFDEAIIRFTEIKDYKDSSQKILESKYKYANQKLDEEKYVEALEIFKELGDYSNSKLLLKKTAYLLGKKYIGDQEYEKAIEIFTDIDGYEDSNQLLIQSKYQLAKELYKNKKYGEAITILDQIKKHKNVEKLLIEINYSFGKKEYLLGHFDNARQLFKKTKEYKDSSTYLKNISTMESYEGTWEDKYGMTQYIFDGWKVSIVFFPNSNEVSVYHRDITLVNNKLKDEFDTIFENRSGTLIVNESYGHRESFHKISTSKNVPEEKPLPEIGMTKDEVLDSKWGRPDDINKTITEYGTSEQWVYDDKGYIYFDDGVVTAIQE